MPYDPAYPATNALLESAPMRGQFQGLKALIDAVSGVTSAVVDAVNTLPPGSPAAVGVSVSGAVLHLSFDLPQGAEGMAGPQGMAGTDGAQGPVGPQGADGAPGPTGADGPPGPPGEVSNADLQTAVNGSSANSNTVGTLGLLVTDPPTQGEVQVIADKLDELINALRR